MPNELILEGVIPEGVTVEPGTVLVFTGKPLTMVGVHFVDCPITFRDEAANTIHFLAALYRMQGQGRQLVEELFDAIRNGTHGQRRPLD